MAASLIERKGDAATSLRIALGVTGDRKSVV